jgi:hypothetical protein
VTNRLGDTKPPTAVEKADVKRFFLTSRAVPLALMVTVWLAGAAFSLEAQTTDSVSPNASAQSGAPAHVALTLQQTEERS